MAGVGFWALVVVATLTSLVTAWTLGANSNGPPFAAVTTYHDPVDVVTGDVLQDRLGRIARLDGRLDRPVGVGRPTPRPVDEPRGPVAGLVAPPLVGLEDTALAHPRIERRHHVQHRDPAVEERERLRERFVRERGAVEGDEDVGWGHGGQWTCAHIVTPAEK